MEYKLIGKIIGFKGLKGEIKIKPFSAFLNERLKPGNIIFLNNGNRFKEYRVKEYYQQNKNHILVLSGLESIDLVKEFNKHNIYMDSDYRFSLAEDEFHQDELLGLKVYQNKELKGEVIDIKNYPSDDYLVVKTVTKNVLIPFRDEFIKSMDKKRIDIVEMEGLF
ncbi:MAG: ribosome maturation factor RimM [Bacillota bacterium]